MALIKTVSLVCLVWVAVLVAGCADHLPHLQSLGPAEEMEGRKLLEQLRENRLPEALDADVTLTWQGYGQTKTMPAELQAIRSGAFRLSVPDPLGRPLVLFVARSDRFTLVDTQRQHAYTGPVRNHLVEKYVPAPITLPLVYSLLVDEIPARQPDRIHGTGGDRQGYWFVFSLGDRWQRMILADDTTPLPLRQLLVSPERHVALDLRYTGPVSPAGKSLLPVRVRISGEKFSGSVQIDFQQYYPHPECAAEIFQLHIPPTFTVETIYE
jgi:hypothetical protein